MSLCLGRLQDTKFAAGVRARQEPVDAHSGTYTDFLRRHERAANKAIQEGPHAVKAMLPQLVDRIADSRNLRAAWDHLARHGGATPGPNGITYRDVEGSEIWELMRTLGRSIREGTYQPGPTRQLRISKGPDRGYRTLTLHNIEDRVVQRAIVQIVQPILDYRFDEHSYGFRPNRGRLNALATAVAESQRGRTTWITEDIKTAFDRVPHGRLQDVLQKRLPDQRLMDLMGTINSNRQKRGIPQGSPLAPLLLNLYLDYHLDRVWRKRSPDQPLLRYADDLLIPCKTRQEATEARKRLERTLTPTGMLLKGTPDTAIRDLSDGDEAEWLGYAVRLEEDGLRIHVTEDAWWELRERLALAHTEELAPLRIVSVLSGWVDQFGPCLPHTDVAAVYARIKEEAGKLAFDEIPGEADVRERIHRAYERWEVLRGRAKGSFTGLVTDGGSACLSTATKRRNGE
ncbi:MAG TPA: Retron-type reverse transcriptase, partial [Planctomycetaceae bacterium]|nr:Retron-type reverse transcriptase [Planctomycetaceae bacterium]